MLMCGWFLSFYILKLNKAVPRVICNCFRTKIKNILFTLQLVSARRVTEHFLLKKNGFNMIIKGY